MLNGVAALDLLPTPLSFAVAAPAGGTDSINPRTSDSLPSNEPPAAAGSQSDASSLIAEFTHTVTAAQKRKEKTFMRVVFDRHAGSKGQLSAPELMAALVPVVMRHEENLTARAGELFPELVATPEHAALFAAVLFAMQGLALQRPVYVNEAKEALILSQFEALASSLFPTAKPKGSRSHA